MVDWSAVGGIAGVIGVSTVIGGAVISTSKGWRLRRNTEKNRLDRLEIRLFGLPKDADSGAPKIPGEFDRIDARLDALPDEIMRRLNNGK